MLHENPLVLAEYHIQRGLAWLPAPLSRFLGYRNKKLPPSPTYVVCLYGFIGAFFGLGAIFAVSLHTVRFTDQKEYMPPIVASFVSPHPILYLTHLQACKGASVILCYGSIDVPQAQPRGLIFGHFFSALIGIIMATVFDLKNEGFPPILQWHAGPLAVAIALIVMHVTKTTHAPAGTTALLPCIDRWTCRLGWYYLLIVLLSSTIVLGGALLVNNVQRQYPTFWITPIPLSQEYSPDQHRNRTLSREIYESPQHHQQRSFEVRDQDVV
jgi:CBS-domain-containing membrane protein